MNRDRKKSAAEAEIDRNLKRSYEDFVHEPLPDRFKDLLNQLRQETTPDTANRKDDTDGSA